MALGLVRWGLIVCGSKMDLLSYDPPMPLSFNPARPMGELLFQPSLGVTGWLAAVRGWVAATERLRT